MPLKPHKHARQRSGATDIARRPICVVAGVGPGIGASLAEQFDSVGYEVVLLARSAKLSTELSRRLSYATYIECDLADPLSVAQVFEEIDARFGRVDVLVYNAGEAIWGNIEAISEDDFESAWRTNVLGAFQATRHVIPAMKRNRYGTIILVGATASLRGKAETTAFCSAKAAQRSFGESAAKYLGPLGIHVALIIVDGMVRAPDAGSKSSRTLPRTARYIAPRDVAAAALMLTNQSPTAWTFEFLIRPSAENW